MRRFLARGVFCYVGGDEKFISKATNADFHSSGVLNPAEIDFINKNVHIR